MKSTWIVVLMAVALGLAAVVAYSDAADNGFVWDDPIVFQRQLPYFEGFENIFFPPAGIPQWGSYYRPLIVVTYLIDEKVAERFWPEEEREEARQVTYHASCIAYHAVATVLVFLFGVVLDRRLTGGSPEGVAAAAAGGLLFALHPIHVESVSWMAGRSDVLCAIFFLPAAWLLVSHARGGGALRLAGALVLTFAALLCKETGLGLLPFALAVAFFVEPATGSELEGQGEMTRAERRRRAREAGAKGSRSRRRPRRGWWAVLGVLAVVLVYLQIRASAIDNMRGSTFTSYVRTAGTTFGEKVIDLFGSVGFYGLKSIWPPPQNAFIADVPGGLVAALGVVLLLGFASWFLGSALKGWARKWRAELLAASFFFAALSPSLLIALFGISETPLAERYLYIPSAGVCLLAGLLFVRLVAWAPARLRTILPIVFAAIIALPASVAISERNAVWESDASFWADAVEKNPDEGLPHLHMGLVLSRQGDRNGALASYKRAVEARYDREGRSKAFNNIASIYVAKGEYDIAISYCRKAIEEAGRPYPTPHYNWALAAINLARRSRSGAERQELLREAESKLRQAISYNARYTKAHYQLGQLLLASNRRNEALQHYEFAARYAPTSHEGRLARQRIESLR